MTRDELAQKINRTSAFLRNIELGLSGRLLKSLNCFCDALKMKMSAEDILYGEREDLGTKYETLFEHLEHLPEDKEKYVEAILALFLLNCGLIA